MRVALVVGSGYSQNGQLTPLPSADLDCELVERRLSDRDAGFRVFRFEAERGLAERIEQHLMAQTEPIEQLLLYFSGYCVVSEDRGPGLLLDGERLGTFSVPRLKKLLEYFTTSSCVIMDAAAVVDGEQAAQTLVQSVGDSLTKDSSTVNVLCAGRKSDRQDSFGGSAFTGLVLMVIDWLAGSRSEEQPIDVRWLFEGLKADPGFFEAIPAVGLFPVNASFVLVPAAVEPRLPRFESAGDVDETTPALASRAEGALPSFASPIAEPSRSVVPAAPPVPWASEPLPSFDSADAYDSTEKDGRLPSFSPRSERPASGAFADHVFADLFGDERPAVPSVTAAPTLEEPAPSRARLPSFLPSPEVADALFEAGEFERAADEYAAAAMLLADPSERVPLLARRATALSRLGRFDEATLLLDEACAIDSAHVEVLAVRAEIALAGEDFDALARATTAWRDRAPTDRRALELSARAAEKLGDPGRAVAARRELASYPDVGVDERAHALFEASRVAESGLGDAELARTLVNEGLALAPARSELLDRADQLFGDASRKEQLVAHYERALAESRDASEITKLAMKLDELCQSGAADPARVARSLEQVVALEPGNLTLCDRLVELYSAGQEPERALEHCRRAARIAPNRAATYRRALGLFEATGAIDGAWNAASVLDCLGEADINEALLASQHKPEGLLAARGSVLYAEWQSALLAADCDSKIWDLLEALGPSGVRAGVGFAKHQKRYVEPDPALFQDPEKSTTMLAKTLGWTARLLGISSPSLYVVPDAGNHLEVAPTEQASAFASRSLASGLGLDQLAFLWGRLLPRFRNELRAVSFFRTPAEFSLLVTAALALGECPGISVRSLEADAKRLYAALRREVRGPAFDRVRMVARDFPSAEVEARAARTLRGIELVGVRAGLVACGDVATAGELVRRYPSEGMTHADEQLAELYAFAIGEAYASLRRRIGVAITA